LSENAYGFFPIPVIITDSAVDGGFGLVGVFFHEDEENQDARLAKMRNANVGAGRYLLPPSVSAVMGVTTGNDSIMTGGGHMGIWKAGAIRYTGGAGYGDVNIDFYGSGDFQLDKPISLNTKALGMVHSLKFQLRGSRLFLGLKQQSVSAEVSLERGGDRLPEGLPDKLKQGLEGILSQEVVTSGLGVLAEYDSRDNVFSPTKGYHYSAGYSQFDETIGSDIDYSVTKFDGRNYWQVVDDWRLAWRLAMESANADDFLPTFALPSLNIRGIPAARYQGKSIAQTELEVSWDINTRWTLKVFSGMGRVADSFEGLGSTENYLANGTGFRYFIAKRYGIRAGIDIARGPDETAWYITAGSAW